MATTRPYCEYKHAENPPRGQAVDMVNHPSHYTNGKIECIDAIESSMTPAQFIGYCKGNIMKYLYRFEHKNGVEDVRKAQWYLNKMLSTLEGNESK